MQSDPINSHLDELLLNAIRQNKLIQFMYQEKQRIAEPHDYGVHKGKVRLLCYQIRGESTGQLPNWRWIEVSGISQLKILEETFSGNRPSGKHHIWDRVYARAKERAS